MMNLNLKRAITLICTLAMLLAAAAPALAAEDVADVPVLEAAPAIAAEAVAPAKAEPAAVSGIALPEAKLQDDEPAATPTITVETKTLGTKIEDGTKDVAVKLSITDNPGITGCVLKVSYDANLTPKAIARGEALASLDFTVPGQFASGVEQGELSADAAGNPLTLVWDGESRDLDATNGVLATLTFTVSTAAEASYEISVATVEGGIYEGSSQDGNVLNDVEVTFVKGGITVVEQTFICGDVNGDGQVTMMDKTFLARFLANWTGYDEKVNKDAADTNGDGQVTMLDKTVLARHIANWTGYETLPWSKS